MYCVIQAFVLFKTFNPRRVRERSSDDESFMGSKVLQEFLYLMEKEVWCTFYKFFITRNNSLFVHGDVQIRHRGKDRDFSDH